MLGGMILPPYEIQEICIQALQVESRNTSLLHLGVCAYFCIARSFGVNANSWFSCPMFLTQNKQKQILHLSIGKLEKTVEQFETSLDESNFRSFKIWQRHNLCKPIVTGRALAALAARKFKMLSMPWQNDTARGEVGFWFHKVYKTWIFDSKNLSFQSQLQQI